MIFTNSVEILFRLRSSDAKRSKWKHKQRNRVGESNFRLKKGTPIIKAPLSITASVGVFKSVGHFHRSFSFFLNLCIDQKRTKMSKPDLYNRSFD